MRRPPVRLDDPALDSAAEDKPVADPVRPRQVERDARKDVAQSALQRKAEDYGYRARRSNQGPYRRIEDVGHDRKDGPDVDHANYEILKELPFAGLPFENQEDADDADQRPRGV